MIPEIWDDPKSIIFFVIGLIVPSAIALYLLICGEILRTTGHEPLGSLIVGLVTFIGKLTGVIGQALLPLAIWLFLLIVIVKALIEALGR